MDALDYWRDLAARSRTEIEATCRAIGAAGYLLGPYCPYTDAERLTHLRDLITALRRALGLDDVDTATKDQHQKGRETR